MNNDKTSLTEADLYRADKVTITRGNILHNLYIGGSINKYPGYTFLAKMYDKPSEVGLEGGRIVQLIVRDSRDQIAFSYDRGSERTMPPSNDLHFAVQKEIIAAFPLIHTLKKSLTQSAVSFFTQGKDLER